MKRILFSAYALTCALALTACANPLVTAGSTVATVGAATTPQTAAQVTTLGQAVQSATLVTQAIDLVVNSGTLSRPVLTQLNTLSNAVHAALGNLQAAQAAGQNLDFSAFNAALAAYNSYASANAAPTVAPPPAS